MLLHSHTHRVPVERDGDLAVLWADPSPASLEERRKILRGAGQGGSGRAQKINANWERSLDLTLEENEISAT
jgi:hypothetical protein